MMPLLHGAPLAPRLMVQEVCRVQKHGAKRCDGLPEPAGAHRSPGDKGASFDQGLGKALRLGATHHVVPVDHVHYC